MRRGRRRRKRLLLCQSSRGGVFFKGSYTVGGDSYTGLYLGDDGTYVLYSDASGEKDVGEYAADSRAIAAGNYRFTSRLKHSGKTFGATITSSSATLAGSGYDLSASGSGSKATLSGKSGSATDATLEPESVWEGHEDGEKIYAYIKTDGTFVFVHFDDNSTTNIDDTRYKVVTVGDGTYALDTEEFATIDGDFYTWKDTRAGTVEVAPDCSYSFEYDTDEGTAFVSGFVFELSGGFYQLVGSAPDENFDILLFYTGNKLYSMEKISRTTDEETIAKVKKIATPGN